MVDNKLIAEFMGLPKVPCNIGTEDGHFNEGYKHPKVGVPIIPSGMQYKYSWDWLMPVVENIQKLYEECMDYNNQMPEDYYYKVLDKGISTPREIIYKAVVEFIKQYNK